MTRAVSRFDLIFRNLSPILQFLLALPTKHGIGHSAIDCHPLGLFKPLKRPEKHTLQRGTRILYKLLQTRLQTVHRTPS